MRTDVLLKAQGLTRRFGGLTAVNNVSFDVRDGEIFGIIGPNGAGKTTLFSMLVGALAPTAGTVTFAGRPIHGLAPHKVARAGVVRTHQIVKPFRDLTVFENVLIGASFGAAPKSGAEARDFVSHLLSYCGLTHRSGTKAAGLPIGELKRLEICRALAAQPRVIMLDEVMGGLNPTEIDGAMDLIWHIRSTGRTVLLIEHHMHAVAGLCDRVMVLQFGQKIAEGPAHAVLTDPLVVEAYLGDAAFSEGEGGS